MDYSLDYQELRHDLVLVRDAIQRLINAGDQHMEALGDAYDEGFQDGMEAQLTEGDE